MKETLQPRTSNDFDSFSIRYQLERKILKELQDLKSCQIRSGRTNEPVLVKRLVDKFRKEVNEPEIAGFNESFSYSTYERFLYGKLRDPFEVNDFTSSFRGISFRSIE